MFEAGRITLRRSRPPHSGFTLIELLVVISIISLLMTFTLPSFGRARRLAKRTSCMASLRSVGQGMESYLVTHQDYYPTAAGYPILKEDKEAYCLSQEPPDDGIQEDLGELLEDPDDGCELDPIYVAIGPEIGFQRQVFQCPADRRETKLINRPNRSSYYNSLGSSYEWDVWYNGRQRGRTLYTGKNGSYQDAGLALPPEQAPMMYDYEPFHGGSDVSNSHVILYADMHVEGDTWKEPPSVAAP